MGLGDSSGKARTVSPLQREWEEFMKHITAVEGINGMPVTLPQCRKPRRHTDLSQEWGTSPEWSPPTSTGRCHSSTASWSVAGRAGWHSDRSGYWRSSIRVGYLWKEGLLASLQHALRGGQCDIRVCNSYLLPSKWITDPGKPRKKIKTLLVVHFDPGRQTEMFGKTTFLEGKKSS